MCITKAIQKAPLLQRYCMLKSTAIFSTINERVGTIRGLLYEAIKLLTRSITGLLKAPEIF